MSWSFSDVSSPQSYWVENVSPEFRTVGLRVKHLIRIKVTLVLVHQEKISSPMRTYPMLYHQKVLQ